MKTKTITLYNFSELSEAAKKIAIEGLRNINVDFTGWESFILDEWNEKLETEGFTDAKIFFSGFWSQGDGACFDAGIDLSKFTDNKRLLSLGQVFYISKTTFANHYSHEKTRYVDFDSIASDRQTNIHNALSELCANIEAKRLELSKEIYTGLQSSFEYATSDEQVIETINSNGYTFTEDGKLENE